MGRMNAATATTVFRLPAREHRAAGSLPAIAVRMLIATVALAGAAVLAAAAVFWSGVDLLALAALSALVFVGERWDVRLRRQSRVSISVAAIIAAAWVAELPGIAVVGLATVAADYASHNNSFYRVLFNAGTLLVSGAAAVAVIEFFPLGESYRWPNLLGPTLAATTVTFLINTCLVALVVALSTGDRFTSVWNDNFRALPAHYLVLGTLGAVMASAYWLDGLLTLAVSLVPVLMMQQIIAQALTPGKSEAQS